MSAMEEMLDVEISFFKQSYERLHFGIERQSTPAVKSRSMLDSGFATIPNEVGVRECLLKRVADDTMVSLNLRQTETLRRRVVALMVLR